MIGPSVNAKERTDFVIPKYDPLMFCWAILSVITEILGKDSISPIVNINIDMKHINTLAVVKENVMYATKINKHPVNRALISDILLRNLLKNI